MSIIRPLLGVLLWALCLGASAFDWPLEEPVLIETFGGSRAEAFRAACGGIADEEVPDTLLLFAEKDPAFRQRLGSPWIATPAEIKLFGFPVRKGEPV